MVGRLLGPLSRVLSLGHRRRGLALPVPIVRKDGKWSFDGSETPAEMRARRVGPMNLTRHLRGRLRDAGCGFELEMNADERGSLVKGRVARWAEFGLCFLNSLR